MISRTVPPAQTADSHFDMAHAPELMGDIPNFTNVTPTMQISRAV